MSICPSCGVRQPDDASFCDECGAALQNAARAEAVFSPAEGRTVRAPAACPVCGAQISSQDAFCMNCGASLREARASPQGASGPHDDATVVAGSSAGSPVGARTTPDSPTVPGLQRSASPGQKPGTPLVCSNCGAQLATDSAFCDMCGEPVRAAAPSPGEGRTQVIRPGPGDAQSDAEQTWAPEPPAPPRGRLQVEGTAVELPLPPGKTDVVIGREDPVSRIYPDVDLTDHGGDEGGVSRQHARIRIQGGGFIVEDLNSTNGTFVNRERLALGQQCPLYDGDEIRLGRVTLRFRVG